MELYGLIGIIILAVVIWKIVAALKDKKRNHLPDIQGGQEGSDDSPADSIDDMDTDNQLSVEGMKKLMQMHHFRMVQDHSSTPGFDVMKPLWDKLLDPETLDYAASGILQESLLAAEDTTHSYQGKNLPGIYVAVSAVPSLDPEEMKRFFTSGYLDFFGQLMKESGYSQGGIDLVHWILCFDDTNQSMNLTFLANNGIEPQSGISLLAQDLMTQKEKMDVGI